jgi:hypothetical protein
VIARYRVSRHSVTPTSSHAYTEQSKKQEPPSHGLELSSSDQRPAVALIDKGQHRQRCLGEAPLADASTWSSSGARHL